MLDGTRVARVQSTGTGSGRRNPPDRAPSPGRSTGGATARLPTLSLPLLRIERRAIGRAEGLGAVEWKGVTVKGDGSLGAVERRWNQNASLAAASVLATEDGTPSLQRDDAEVSLASTDQGLSVTVQAAFAAMAINAKYGQQNLSDAAVEFKLDVRQLAKEPFGRLLDASANNASGPALPEGGIIDDLLRGSPAADRSLR